MGFEQLVAPVDGVDEWLTGVLDGAPMAVALLVALVLGLRHASDPDHLVAVTSLVAADGGNTRGAARLGVWWGIGHASTLLVVGVPLIIFKSALPRWLESGAEKAVGLVLILLATRVIGKWVRGDYRSTAHDHAPATTDVPHPSRLRHLYRADRSTHRHVHVRSPRQAFAIGTLHGLAGTGAVVVLLIASLPSRAEALVALAVFAPASLVSMAACTSAYAWVFTRRRIEPVYRAVVVPAIGALGVTFGLWYTGIT